MTAPIALVVIDAQVNMFDPAHPVAFAEDLLGRLQGLIARARAAGAPVVFVRNCGGPEDPDQRGSPGWMLHPGLPAAEGDPVLDKTTCDTFASTDLARRLAERGTTRIVVAGLQSEFCVRETTLGALERGLAVTLVSNGHSTYDGKTRTAVETTADVNAELEGRVTLRTAEEVGFAPDAEEIRALLGLEAHPLEGGFYAETWRGAGLLSGESLGAGQYGPRSIGTAIYYLLTPETCSSMHRVRWDEVFHFYLGDPVELLLLRPGHEGRVATLGTDLHAGQRPQLVVPAGTWQGARLASGGRVALLGTTMAPGFDSADFEIGDPRELATEWPGFKDGIATRTLPT